jgi:hypothetical protein
MANGTTDPAWSTLESKERVTKIMDLMKAFAQGTDGFRADCLNPDPKIHRPAIEGAAKVKFESNYVLQCYPNRKAVEDQIVLLFPSAPSTPPPAPEPTLGPVKEYWLCTYVDYVPA